MSLFQSKEKDGTINLAVSGYLTKEPKTFEKDGRITMALFSVCYGKSKYMDIKVPGFREELLNLALCLEAKDNVEVKGVFESYTGKDGTQHSQIFADWIAVLQAPPAAEEREQRHSAAENSAPALREIQEEEDDGDLPF